MYTRIQKQNIQIVNPSVKYEDSSCFTSLSCCYLVNNINSFPWISKVENMNFFSCCQMQLTKMLSVHKLEKYLYQQTAGCEKEQT